MNTHITVESLDRDRTEIITSSARLAEIAPIWADLWQRANGLMFQSPDWVRAWWETLPDRDEYKLHIGVIWQGERLLAVMPLATSRRSGIRMLEWAARSYSDYCDILADLGCPADALGRLWSDVASSGGFDLVFLNRLLPEAVVGRVLRASPASSVTVKPNRREEISCRVSGEWQSGAKWVAAQKKKIRQEYQRHRRILGEMGDLRFRLVGDDEPLDLLLSRFMELKRLNLAASNRSSALFDAESRTLGAQVTAMRNAGILHVFTLECDGRPIAFSINFLQHGSMMAYVTTYDPAYSRGSPGDVLIMDYIQWSIDHGCRTIDFLCGGERFKNKFATEVVVLRSVAGAASLKGHLVQALDLGRQKLRKWAGKEAG